MSGRHRTEGIHLALKVGEGEWVMESPIGQETFELSLRTLSLDLVGKCHKGLP